MASASRDEKGVTKDARMLSIYQDAEKATGTEQKEIDKTDLLARYSRVFKASQYFPTEVIGAELSDILRDKETVTNPELGLATPILGKSI